MLQYNYRKNFNNVPSVPDAKNHKKTPLILWPKKMETYSLSEVVARNLGEEDLVPLDHPHHHETNTVQSEY